MTVSFQRPQARTPDAVYDALAELMRRLEPEGVHRVGTPGEPAFNTNWRNWGGVSAFLDVGFYKDALGRVWLQGLAEKITVAPANGDVIFTLPIGYRPVEDAGFTSANSGNNLGDNGRIDVQADGDVAIVLAGGAAPQYYFLDEINFRAA